MQIRSGIERDFSFHGLACFPDYDEDDQSFSFSIGPMTVLHFRDVIVAVFIAQKYRVFKKLSF